ncbi:hypothetical protein H0H81_010619 [Sphagnurus paluster]|uniref:Uncharacterized protein n=1 Tax=Sphagnurus paluster TaxID=117069 RepID=A0A9P7GSK1_9AGAR|nr:hypothetical protein H0H81_010619 [Sphagnurus paluster]
MDVDPLSDTVPPRHAIESDEEEDEYNPLRPSSSVNENQVADARVIGNIPEGRSLVLATGDVAKYWARGALLGEQSGAVMVNNIQPSVDTSHDHYFRGAYASPRLGDARIRVDHSGFRKSVEAPISHDNAPLRYLSTASSKLDKAVFESAAEPYAPPNLIQSTSAALLSILSTSHPSVQGTLILVPSPHIPHPSPKVLAPSNFLQLAEDRFEWAEQTLNAAHELLFAVIGENKLPKWEHGDNRKGVTRAGRKKSDVGDGGMYI